MADYKESTVSGTKWQRASRVVIENPFGGTPHVSFVEEEVVNFGDKQITNPCANLIVQFDPAAEIALVDPATGTPTGKVMSHADLYAALHSLYMQEAVKRDAVAAQGVVM